MLIGATEDTPQAVHQQIPVLTHIIETFRPAANQPEREQPGKPGTNK